MARDEISLGVEFLGGVPEPSTDDVGKIVEVALDEYGDPTFIYVTQTASVADQPFADTLAPFLGTNQDLADDLAPLLEAPMATQDFADALSPLLANSDHGDAIAPHIEGRLLRAPQILASGTGATINHPANTRLIRIRGVGGGGAGGGTNAAAGAGGANGGSATYGEKVFNASASSSTYTVGAAGAGVSGAAGGDGTASTFTHGATTVTLPPGGGGAALAGGSTIARAAGGTAGGAATNADLSAVGVTGGDVVRTAAATTPIFQSSPAGSTPLGNGGRGLQTSTTFIDGEGGTGYGAGGSGRVNGTTATAAAGAAGAPGVWIVEEYS